MLNVLTYEFSKNFATFILEDHRIPANIDINERQWTGRFRANETSFRFICRHRFRNNREVVNLLNVFHRKVCFRFFVIDEKRTTVMKNLSIYSGHHIFAFLNSFLKILNRYDVLISISVILNK